MYYQNLLANNIRKSFRNYNEHSLPEIIDFTASFCFSNSLTLFHAIDIFVKLPMFYILLQGLISPRCFFYSKRERVSSHFSKNAKRINNVLVLIKTSVCLLQSSFVRYVHARTAILFLLFRYCKELTHTMNFQCFVEKGTKKNVWTQMKEILLWVFQYHNRSLCLSCSNYSHFFL